MKYLKLFEDIKDFYYKIPITEFAIYGDRLRLINFDNEEAKKIKLFISNVGGYFSRVVGRDFVKFINYEDSYKYTYIDISKPNPANPDGSPYSARLSIYKLIDEWYLVFNTVGRGVLYKCDQMEGLLKCLQDIL